MEHRYKTAEVARILGRTPGAIISGLRNGRMEYLPEKDSSGDYIWTDADLDRAKMAFSIDRRRKAQAV